MSRRGHRSDVGRTSACGSRHPQDNWRMDTHRIGSLQVSLVGLGCNNFGMRLDYEGSEAVVQSALAMGITLFDTADIYGNTQSEEFLGRALKNHRQKVLIATKFGMRIDDRRQGAKPAYVRQAV